MSDMSLRFVGEAERLMGRSMVESVSKRLLGLSAQALGVLSVGIVLSGCANSGVSSASLLSTSATTEAPAGQAAVAPAAPVDPLARPVYVATTSAQAVKCGFFFDPAKLRANFMTQEAQAGAEQAAKSEKAYDAAFKVLSSRLQGADDFCTEGRTAEIKGRLTRHLANDFAPPVAKAKPADDGWFSLRPNTPTPLNRDAIFDPGPRGRS